MMNNFNGQPVQGFSSQPNYGYQIPNNINNSYDYNRPLRMVQRVEGEPGIKAYQLNPNESVIAVDTTTDGVLWIKACDSTGFPTIRKINYSFEEQPQTNNDYVSRKDFDDLLNKFNKLLEELNGKPNT